MLVVRRFSLLCCVVFTVAAMSGCTTVKTVSSSVGQGVSNFWTKATDRNAEDTAPQAEAETAPEVVVEAPAPETTPEPTPAPEPVVEAPTPEPAPVATETEPQFPPGGPVVFDDAAPAAPEPAAPPAPVDPETVEVLVPEGTYRFVPRQLTVYEGDTVIWRNTSGLVHLFATIPGSDPSGTMEIEPADLLVGEQFRHTFNTAGSYPYFCFIHNRMTGKIVVLPR